MARFSCRGFVDGLLNGLVIALPPVLNYGTPELQERVVPEVSLIPRKGEDVTEVYVADPVRKEVHCPRHHGSIRWKRHERLADVCCPGR